MRFHHGVALLAVVALPVLAGLAAAIEAGYRKVPGGGVVVSALVAMLLGLAVVVPVAHRCSASWDAALAAPRLLGPEELATLRRTTLFCPTVYRFKRKGHDDCLVSDGDGGAFIGCG